MSIDQATTTHLIPTPEGPPSRSVPISDDEILSDREMTGAMWSAYVAFATQPAYFATMCEEANVIDYKRQLWMVRRDAAAMSDDPKVQRAIEEQLMIERDITPARRERRKPIG